MLSDHIHQVVLVTASKDAAYLVVAQANDDLPAYNVDRLKACAIRSRSASVEHRAQRKLKRGLLRHYSHLLEAYRLNNRGKRRSEPCTMRSIDIETPTAGATSLIGALEIGQVHFCGLSNGWLRWHATHSANARNSCAHQCCLAQEQRTRGNLKIARVRFTRIDMVSCC